MSQRWCCAELARLHSRVQFACLPHSPGTPQRLQEPEKGGGIHCLVRFKGKVRFSTFETLSCFMWLPRLPIPAPMAASIRKFFFFFTLYTPLAKSGNANYQQGPFSLASYKILGIGWSGQGGFLLRKAKCMGLCMCGLAFRQRQNHLTAEELTGR